MSPVQRDAFLQFLRDGLVLGYVHPVRDTFVNNIFGLDEGRKWRWILDFTKLNMFQHQIKLKMLTVAELGQRIPRGAWGVVGDFQTFYWQFAMHWTEALRQGFAITKEDVSFYCEHGPREFVTAVMEMCGGRFPTHFTHPVAGMGVRQAQQKCCRYPRLLQQKARSLGIQVEGYSDEWIVLNQSRAAAYLDGGIICIGDHGFGLAYTWCKHNPLPTQTPEFIGYEWWTVLLRTRPLWKRIAGAQASATALLDLASAGASIPIRRQASEVGVVIGLRPGIRKAGLMARPALAEMGSNIRRNILKGTVDYDALVPVTHVWVALCEWMLQWTDHDLWHYMRREAPRHMLTADASEFGWCGHNEDQSWVRRGLFSPAEQLENHNVQEGAGGDHTLVLFGEEFDIRGTPELPVCIGQETDNKTVRKCLSALMCRSLALCRQLSATMDWMDYRSIQSWSVYIPKRVMDYERVADQGSRQISRWYRWMLVPRIVHQVTLECNLDMARGIDLFSEAASAQFPRMVTETWHPLAMWTDALARPWSAEDNPLLQPPDWLWAFPPPWMLSEISKRLATAGCRILPMLLIVPHMPTKGWWKELQPRWARAPLPVGPMRAALQPPEGWNNSESGNKPPAWDLVCLLLLPTIPTKLGHPSSTVSTG
jgi:hypothetical protein